MESRFVTHANGMISAHCNLYFPEIGFHPVGQAGLKLLTSGDLPASASQSAGITDMSCRARPKNSNFYVTRTGQQVECSGTVIPHYSLYLLGSSDPLASASCEAGTTEMESFHVAQAGLKLLTTSNPPALVSQSAGIIGMSHYTGYKGSILLLKKLCMEVGTSYLSLFGPVLAAGKAEELFPTCPYSQELPSVSRVGWQPPGRRWHIAGGCRDSVYAQMHLA
ncbi:hypothetical protein AAY473_006701 [Plecturocebus cupreus]